MDNTIRRRFVRYFAAQHLLSDVLYTVAAAFLWQLHLAQLSENHFCLSSSSSHRFDDAAWSYPKPYAFPCNSSLFSRLYWTCLKAPKVLLTQLLFPFGTCYLAHLLVISAKILSPTSAYLEYIRSPVVLLARHLPGFSSGLLCWVFQSACSQLPASSLHNGAYWSAGLHFVFASIFLPVPFQLQMAATVMKALELSFLWKVQSVNPSPIQLLSRLLPLALPCMFCWYWEHFQLMQFTGMQEGKSGSSISHRVSKQWLQHGEGSSSNSANNTNNTPSCSDLMEDDSCCKKVSSQNKSQDVTSKTKLQKREEEQGQHVWQPAKQSDPAALEGFTPLGKPSMRAAHCGPASGVQVFCGTTPETEPDVSFKIQQKEARLAVPQKCQKQGICQLPAEQQRTCQLPSQADSLRTCISKFRAVLQESSAKANADNEAPCTLLERCLNKLEAAEAEASKLRKSNSGRAPKCSSLYSAQSRVRLMSVKVHHHPRNFDEYASDLQSNVVGALKEQLGPCSSVVVMGCVQLLMWASQTSDAASQDQLLQQAIELFNQLPAVDSQVPDVDIHISGRTFCFRDGDVASVIVSEEAGGISEEAVPPEEPTRHHVMRAMNTPRARCCLSPACIDRSVTEESAQVELKVVLELPRSPHVLEMLGGGMRVVVQGKGRVLADVEPAWTVVGSTHAVWLVGCSIQVTQPRETCKVHVAVLTNSTGPVPSPCPIAPREGLPIASTCFLALPGPAALEVAQLFEMMLAELSTMQPNEGSSNENFSNENFSNENFADEGSSSREITQAPEHHGRTSVILEASPDQTHATVSSPDQGHATMGSFELAAQLEGDEGEGRLVSAGGSRRRSSGSASESLSQAGGLSAEQRNSFSECSEPTSSFPSLLSEVSEATSPTSLEAVVQGLAAQDVWAHTSSSISSSITDTPHVTTLSPAHHPYPTQLEAWETHFQGFVEDFAHLALLQESTGPTPPQHDPAVWAPEGPMEQLVEFMTHHSMWNSLQVLLARQVGVDAVGSMAVKVLQQGASSAGSQRVAVTDGREAGAKQGRSWRAVEAGRKAVAWLTGLAEEGEAPDYRLQLQNGFWSVVRASVFPLQMLGSLMAVKKAKALGLSDVMLALLLVVLHSLLLGPCFRSRPRTMLVLQTVPFLGLLLLCSRTQWSLWQLCLLSGTILLHAATSVTLHLLGMSWLPQLQSSGYFCLAAILLHLLHTAASKVPCLPSDAVLALIRSHDTSSSTDACCAQPGSAQCTVLLTVITAFGVLAATILLSSARLPSYQRVPHTPAATKELLATAAVKASS